MEPHFLRELLDPLASTCRTGWLESDPVEMVHRFRKRDDIEVAGLFASSLALGRVTSIRARITDLLERLEQSPAEVCRSSSPAQMARRFRGFRHRFFSGADLTILGANIGRLVRAHGSLELFWRSCEVMSQATGQAKDSRVKDSRDKIARGPTPMSDVSLAPGARGSRLEEAADRFARALSAPVKGVLAESRLPLVVSPAGGSTCKRLAMYLRWMVRPADGVDLGIWTCLKPSELVIPLDVHLFRISRLLGLTDRRTANWATVRSVTSALSLIDPEDPVKYDFALSRIGIVHGCRGRWHAAVCPGCPVRAACSAARRRRGAPVKVRIASREREVNL